MFKYLYSFIILFLLFPAVTLAFPNDAKTINGDFDTGTSGTLATSALYDRTILYLSSSCDGNKDTHVDLGTTHIIDTEGNPQVYKFTSQYWPAGIALNWSKPLTSDKCFFTVVYTDYNLASSTNAVFNSQTSSTTTASLIPMSNFMENIGYISTSTILADGRIITQGNYNISFILFLFVFLSFIFTLACVLFFYLITRSKAKKTMIWN